jgi:heme-degrading monooxygenase HmoA
MIARPALAVASKENAFGTNESIEARWARVWRGWTRLRDYDAYSAYLYNEGCKAIEAIPGNLGVKMLRRKFESKAEFVVISFWASLESIRQFAGADISLAHPLEKDSRYLLKMPRHVDHFEIYAEADN